MRNNSNLSDEVCHACTTEKQKVFTDMKLRVCY